MDMHLVIYFLGIVVGAFADVEKRAITFYKDLYYKGESRTMAVSVGTPEGSPCESCYNFIGDVANQLKFRRPGSIEVPPDHYIRLHENFNCHGHHITFCSTACNCNSSHIDLSGNNHKCYVTNISRNFCPGGSVFHTVSTGSLNQDNCYGYQPGLYSFSVHKRPEGGQILWLEYPGSVFGKYISFEKCTANDILRISTTNELPNCSCDVKENYSRDDVGEYCFWRRWLVAMHYGNYLLQFTRIVNNNNQMTWSFLAPFGNFFGVQPRYGEYNYSNVLYAVLVKTITNSVPREHREALRICASKVFDYRRDDFRTAKFRHFLRVSATNPGKQALIEASRFNIIDFRILVLWKMIKKGLDLVIEKPEGQVLEMSERVQSNEKSFFLKINGIIKTLWKEQYDEIFNEGRN